MKLILDEWIVREVIDTLYMARTTFLGITGLDSPQEVEKKSANETAITRRISKAIDLIQQSEHIPESLEEAAEKHASSVEGDYAFSEGPDHYCSGDLEEAFIAGAEWQRERDMDEWLKDRDGCFWDGVNEGKKAGYEQAKKDILAIIESRLSEIIGDAQPKPALRAELQELITKCQSLI